MVSYREPTALQNAIATGRWAAATAARWLRLRFAALVLNSGSIRRRWTLRCGSATTAGSLHAGACNQHSVSLFGFVAIYPVSSLSLSFVIIIAGACARCHLRMAQRSRGLLCFACATCWRVVYAAGFLSSSS
jgi:hypothetical protein